MVPVKVQDELKGDTSHNNFGVFVCLKAEWYCCSFLFLIFRATPQALESKNPPATLRAAPGCTEASTYSPWC